MHGELIEWPGGKSEMRLALGEFEALQKDTEVGPEFLFHKILQGHWTAHELARVLYWGLVGGGMRKAEADTAVSRAFETAPLTEFKAPAAQVLANALFGPPDDPVGEGSPVENPTPGEQKTEDGNLAPTTI